MSTQVLQFMTGNPLQKTNSGSIELFKECSLGVFDDHQLLDPARLSAEKTDLQFADKCLVCIVTVPSFMIPHDILQFLKPVLPDIKSVSTLRHYATHDSYFVLLEMTCPAAASSFIQEYHGAPLCSLQPTTCLAYSVKDVVHSDAGGTDMTESSPSIDYNNCSDSRGETEEGGEEELCVLCLAPLEKQHPSSFTTCCGHTFHIACTLHLENSQCPVCRSQLDDAAMDSQSRCAVCSWPHHQPAPASSTATGQREQWLEGDHDLWVCLVCGFIGCGEAHSASGDQGGGHMREHYQQHLHAYAMNTETRRVWDFAGEGYVHRLILNQHEGGTSSTDLGMGRAPHGPSLKIVEVHRPAGHRQGQGQGHQGLERSQVPPLSQQQEDFVVTRKLETAAEHFSAVLAWKLEQQRQHFEGQLAHLRALNASQSSSHCSASSNDTGGEGHGSREDRTSRSKQIILSLKNEKLKLLRQSELAHERLKATLEDRNLLSTFTTNLQENQQEWEGRALVAKDDLQAAEDSYR
mmetsp:Transcript_4034/g.6846  ORF Transcript_4034/g.6846 Transcript_4034/m.6846 type:complete len:520 (-) Transcript_4034:1048-2607(-)